jgi:integrase
MARAEKRLSARMVQTIKAPGLHADGGGLYLHVSKSGSKSWIYRWRRNGRLHDMGLGPLNTIGLAEARDRALACRKQVYNGADPIVDRRAKRLAARLESAKAMTFRQCADAYIAAHKAGWRSAKHARQWVTTLETYVDPVIGDLPVQTVDLALLMRIIEPIWTTNPVTASRIRGRIESVLDWARTRGYRDGENPARWRGHLENLLPAQAKVKRVEHHAALPYREMAAFIAELRKHGAAAAEALRFAILTAARTGEVLGARWSEIDLDARLWVVPAERMKGGREHRIPLSEPAIDVVRLLAAQRESEFVFPGQKPSKPLSNAALRKLLARMGRSDITVHGFRSAFADWCTEQTAFSIEAREMALAHAVGNKTEAAYRRGDLFEKRRQLAEAWARFCTTPLAASAPVVAIGAARV